MLRQDFISDNEQCEQSECDTVQHNLKSYRYCSNSSSSSSSYRVITSHLAAIIVMLPNSYFQKHKTRLSSICSINGKSILYLELIDPSFG